VSAERLARSVFQPRRPRPRLASGGGARHVIGGSRG
jgi:hypothetical protein